MRILLWIENYHPIIGGIQVGVRQYLAVLHQLGHEVKVVSTHLQSELPDVVVVDGITIHRFHFRRAMMENNPAFLLRQSQQVTKLLREFAPDIVHIMGYGPSGLFYLRTRKSYTAPYIFSIRNEDSQYLEMVGEGGLLRQLIDEASWVTTASQLEAARFAAKIPEIAAKISCVYHGLPQPDAAMTTPPEQPRLLCIGRIVHQKNFLLAIHAFARVATAFPDARLVFAGDGWERPLMEQLVAELGLVERVDFLGWVQPEQIPALINQASAVVLPSRWEGLPLTGIQTAQMARPLIATRVSGTPELVVDGVTGLLTPSEDVEALAIAMQTLLSDPERAAQMGQAAHAAIYTKFSQERMVENYLSLYARALAQPQ